MHTSLLNNQSKRMSSTAEGAGLKQFVSQDVIDEAKKKRQEEWERVRKPEDPEEAPEEAYDPRSLYDQLQAHKMKKDDEFAEKHRLSNQVKTLDDDEAQFLDFVSDKQEEIHRKREEEDTAVLDEYRSAVVKDREATLLSNTAKSHISVKQKDASQPAKKSHSALLAGAVKRKSTDTTSIKPEEKKAKTSTDTSGAEGSITEPAVATDNGTEAPEVRTAQVIGVLPGLGAYSASSESDSSSDSEIDLPPDIFQCRKIIMSCNSHEGGS